MVKAIWAVACSVLLTGAVLAAQGCSATPKVQRSQASGNGSAAPTTLVLPEAAGGAADVAGPNYRIGPEDVLRVSVWDNKELTLDVVVRPDGMISLPLIQDIQAEGLTAAELAAYIRKRLVEFIFEPNVSVIVTQVNAPKVFVIGEVARPGPYPLRGQMSVLHALSLAGGFKEFASPKEIVIVRANGGRQESRVVNFYEMIKDQGRGNYLLQPGDTIVVP